MMSGVVTNRPARALKVKPRSGAVPMTASRPKLKAAAPPRRRPGPGSPSRAAACDRVGVAGGHGLGLAVDHEHAAHAVDRQARIAQRQRAGQVHAQGQLDHAAPRSRPAGRWAPSLPSGHDAGPIAARKPSGVSSHRAAAGGSWSDAAAIDAARPRSSPLSLPLSGSSVARMVAPLTFTGPRSSLKRRSTSIHIERRP